MKHLRSVICLCVLCAVVLAVGAAMAGAQLWDPSVEKDGEVSPLSVTVGEGITVHATQMGEETWFFLPGFADMAALFPDAQETDYAEGVYVARLGDADVYVMQSAGLRTVFLSSDDPDTQGRAYVENCQRHENKASGSIVIVNADGETEYAGALKQIRGRGNFTWRLTKKAYQIKLTDKADLLKTGDPDEANRTWALLADATDGTMLHNRIALDMGLEFGIPTTSHSESVDLYYDGEYRGLYLLTEKVEAGKGRLNVKDFSKAVEEWNDGVDLESLPVRTGVNRFGNAISFIEGLNVEDTPDSGAYVLEMDRAEGTLSDRCWFEMGDIPGQVMALKSPENASEDMLLYISERLTEARETLQNGGIHPETGRTLEEDFDVEAFARILLLNELVSNADSYSYSSSWFVLDAGESRFLPGPGWDYDLSMRIYRGGMNENGQGIKLCQDSWLEDFYRCPAVVSVMQRLWEEELQPMIQNILLGTEEGTYLKPLDVYTAEIETACRMDHARWNTEPFRTYRYGLSLEGDWAALRTFFEDRLPWLRNALKLAVTEPDTVLLWGNAFYADVAGSAAVYTAPWCPVDVTACEAELVSEATEEAYAVYKLSVTLTPKEGKTLTAPKVIFDSAELPCTTSEDGTLHVECLFDDLSYLPVYYDDTDLGLVYNESVYRANYPELDAEYADDSEGLLAYFWDVGMYEGAMANGCFLPSELMFYRPELAEAYGSSWDLYYMEYLDHGYDEGWCSDLGFGFAITPRTSEP